MCCGGSCSAGSDVVVFLKFEVLLFGSNVVMFCIVTHMYLCDGRT